jgi:hypothetical protein
VIAVFELRPWRGEIAPSVRDLLEVFHNDTPRKLELAPTDSAPKLHTSDGKVLAIAPDGWPNDYGEN